MRTFTKIIAIPLIAFCSLTTSAQNLIDMSDWVSGTNGATTNYNLQGSAAQNSRITMTGPYGSQVTVWEASADGSSGMNGGLQQKGIIVDTDKTYRVSFWIQSTGPNNCSNTTGFTPYYTGGGLIQPFENENGSSVNWPYFSSINQPNDKWFLIVAYVRPPSSADIGDSGVYDPTMGSASNIPAPDYPTTDFIFPTSITQLSMRIRSFMWNCGSGEKMFVYDPRIEEVPNVTSLSELLYGTTSADTQAPTAPTLSSTGQTETTVDLSWSGATDDTAVTGYTIYKDGVLETTLGNVSTYQATGLTASTAYDFTVTALDAAGNESVASNMVAVTTNSAADTQDPTAPTLTSTGQTTTTADLSWSGATDNVGVTGYKVFKDGTLETTLANVTTYQVTGLTASTTYGFTVTALDAVANESVASNMVSVTTNSSSDTQAPTAPTLTSTGQTTTTADLSWSSATDNVGVTGYRVFKDGTLETTLANVSNYQVMGLTAGTSYDFTVTALDAAGNESVASNAVSVTTDSSGGGTTVWTQSSGNISYNTGNVGIGTSDIPTNYMLAVNGKIISEELKVQLQTSWPDYVFDKDYNLPSLDEIQRHIEEKGHLPNMPSAKEVEENGLEVGEMNRLLLEKIEELTLHIIDLKKELETIKSNNE